MKPQIPILITNGTTPASPIPAASTITRASNSRSCPADSHLILSHLTNHLPQIFTNSPSENSLLILLISSPHFAANKIATVEIFSLHQPQGTTAVFSSPLCGTYRHQRRGIRFLFTAVHKICITAELLSSFTDLHRICTGFAFISHLSGSEDVCGQSPR